jgi:hypothetical protein
LNSGPSFAGQVLYHLSHSTSPSLKSQTRSEPSCHLLCDIGRPLHFSEWPLFIWTKQG